VHRDHRERELVNLFYNNNPTNFLNCAKVKDDLKCAESRMLAQPFLEFIIFLKGLGERAASGWLISDKPDNFQ
jgi:hypothetical protein